jgi:hypothetical protein
MNVMVLERRSFLPRLVDELVSEYQFDDFSPPIKHWWFSARMTTAFVVEECSNSATVCHIRRRGQPHFVPRLPNRENFTKPHELNIPNIPHRTALVV